MDLNSSSDSVKPISWVMVSKESKKDPEYFFKVTDVAGSGWEAGTFSAQPESPDKRNRRRNRAIIRFFFKIQPLFRSPEVLDAAAD